MRSGLKAILILLIAGSLCAPMTAQTSPRRSASSGVERHYYIAAEDVTWDFAPSNRNLMHNSRLPALWLDHTKWPKQRYVEYTDATFTVKKPQPEWLGILGPIIRGEVGDTIYVHFFNRAMGTHSIHSHGVLYDKNSEGADYAYAERGSAVQHGAQYTYKWRVTPESGPAPGEPSSRVWLYHGHVDEPEETNAGLIGPIIITAKGQAKPDGSPKDVDQEFVVLFMIFDQSPLPPMGTRRSQLQFVLPQYEFSSMNGYFFGNLPGLVMREGEHVRWHTMAMGTETDMHTPHWHGNRVAQSGHTSDVRMLLPAMTDTVDMTASNPGTWMFQCHVADHMDEGMMNYYTVLPKAQACPVEFSEPVIAADGSLSYEVKNTAGTAIKNAMTHAEMIAGWHVLATVPTSLLQTNGLSSGQATAQTVHNPMSGAAQAMGYVAVPESVTFADGRTWTPRYRGECARTVFRNPKDSFTMPVLPPDQAHEHNDVED